MGTDHSPTPPRSSHRRWMIVAAIGLFAVGIAAAAYWYPRPQPPIVSIAKSNDDDIDEPRIDPNPGYVGMQACVACHAQRVADVKTTKHFNACREPEPGMMAPGFAPGQGDYTSPDPKVHFEMKQSGNEFFQTNIRNTPEGERRFDAKIGLVYGSTGTADEVYFTWHGDRLYELPVVWLHPDSRWANSPFSPFGNADLTRTTTTRCLECHNTWVEHVPGTENQFKHDHMVLGVTCEKCHGPGCDHVEFHKANPADQTAHAIVRPRQLSRELQMDVCAQCHSNSNKPRGPAFSYRPGEPLDAHFRTSIIKYPEKDHVIDQVKYLRQSKCYQNSEMTCVTCHDPHRVKDKDPNAKQRSCLKCHENDNGKHCKEQPKIPLDVRGDCVGCHMPQYTRIQVYFHTDDDSFVAPVRPKSHRIVVSPTATQAVLLAWHRTQPDDTNRREAERLKKALVDHWLAEADAMHTQYRYMAEIGALRELIRIDSAPAYRERIRQVAAIEKQLEDDEYVALHQRDENRFTDAIATCERILKVKPDWAKIHVQLGALYAETGKRDLAIHHWNQVEKCDPDDANGHVMLGKLAMVENRLDDALVELRKADEIEPNNVTIFYRIGMVHAAQKNWIEAEKDFGRVLAIDPNHAEANREMIRMLREQRKKDEAVTFARRAAKRTQNQNFDILNSLAETYADLGRFDEARETCIRAADVAQKTNPEMATQLRRNAEEYRQKAKAALK